MADDKKDKKSPIDILGDLADPNAKASTDYADLAGPSDKWYEGKKLYLSKFPPVPPSEDLNRILELPSRPTLDLDSDRAAAMVDLMTGRWGRGERQCDCAKIDPRIAAGKRKCIKRFKPVQAWALYEMGIHGGLLAHIPVGAGKTLIGIMSPLALEPLGVKRALLLIPPNLVEQLVRDYQVIAEHFRVPALYVHGIERRFPVEGAPVLHVMPYSRLSLPNASDWVRNLRPDAIIADECDRLRDPNGAGASRIVRYFREFGDTTRFCGWTGSLTDSAIGDYAHLSALALRMRSPLPLDHRAVTDWGRALDESDNPAPAGALAKLCENDETLDPDNPDDLREGYRRRLAATPGVVVSTEASVEIDLIIRERAAPPIPPIIREALHKVRTLWVRPDTLVPDAPPDEVDEELVDAMEVAKVARELASGIFYRWRFNPIRGVPQLKTDVKEWREARKLWNRELRSKLVARDEWLDSPLLCEHAAQRFHGDRPKREDRPEWNSTTYKRWSKIKGKVVPTVEPCRVSDYLAVDAARWGLENLGVIWYGMVEFGQWVAELGGLALHGGGPKAGERIAKEVGDRSIVCSIKSHGRGRDGLQALFGDQLIAQLPSSATMNEQLLGRLHRQGSNFDEVRADYYAHTPEIKEALETALRRARYVRGTLGASQKLLDGLRNG